MNLEQKRKAIEREKFYMIVTVDDGVMIETDFRFTDKKEAYKAIHEIARVTPAYHAVVRWTPEIICEV